MKLIGKYIKSGVGGSDDISVTFDIPNYHQRELLKELNYGNEYSIDIENIKKKRSLRQNNYMWKLLKDIANYMNGDNDDTEIYCLALKRANVKSELLCCDKRCINMLKERFRAIRYVGEVKEKEGYDWYQVFPGSSTMNTKQMSELIDVVLDMAVEVGIDIGYWSEVLKG